MQNEVLKYSRPFKRHLASLREIWLRMKKVWNRLLIEKNTHGKWSYFNRAGTFLRGCGLVSLERARVQYVMVHDEDWFMQRITHRLDKPYGGLSLMNGHMPVRLPLPETLRLRRERHYTIFDRNFRLFFIDLNNFCLTWLFYTIEEWVIMFLKGTPWIEGHVHNHSVFMGSVWLSRVKVQGRCEEREAKQENSQNHGEL